MKKMQLKFNNKIIILFINLLIGFTSFSQSGKVIDKVVAQIGDEIIMLSDIQGQKLQMIQNSIDITSQTDCEILEELLYQKLLISQAIIDSIQVSDDMVNGEMEQRIRYFEEQIGGRKELEEFYGKSVAQIKAEFFYLIRKRMLAEFMEDKITENLIITPNDVKEFFNALPKSDIPYINSKISIGQIVIYPEITEKDKLAAKAELEGYRKEIIEKKKKFETIAITKSDDPGSKLKEGNLGWNKRGTMVPEFEAVTFGLEKNEISEVFETQYGYHIVQLLDRRGDNYHVRHILISPKASNTSFENAAIKMDEIYKDIKKGKITFEEAALKHSSDENSKNNGGKIVNPYTNDYYWDIQNINDIDPQMYRIIDRMNINDISTPSLYDNYFEQKSGIRIIKLIDRTKPHQANLKEDYQLIQNACYESKKQELINDWIQEKIKGMYIKIDEDYHTCKFQYNWLKNA